MKCKIHTFPEYYTFEDLKIINIRFYKKYGYYLSIKKFLRLLKKNMKICIKCFEIIES